MLNYIWDEINMLSMLSMLQWFPPGMKVIFFLFCLLSVNLNRQRSELALYDVTNVWETTLAVAPSGEWEFRLILMATLFQSPSKTRGSLNQASVLAGSCEQIAKVFEETKSSG